MTWKQALTIALLVTVGAAAIVWFLEDFNRQRMISEMRDFLDGLPTKQSDAA